ncbi:hypothetical protein ACPOL_3496 [Acidisarcina polymorpha]|uniref:Uncharacterized protein n=1 Tax=Acidisarcina polymorpha TaxID=2211140 RepID=A0A2Z5G0V0_9BACT|nr:hypothetical protein ACPOL_3496 [Acidisarcina polymorpha]
MGRSSMKTPQSGTTAKAIQVTISPINTQIDESDRCCTALINLRLLTR